MAKAYFTLTYGLQGGYMPDSNLGPYKVTTRRELMEAMRDALAMYDAPKSAMSQVKWRERVWPHIKRHGASSLHFCIATDKHNVLEFHGLTTEEYNTAMREQCEETGEEFIPEE